jgi:hypothetical protein
MKEGAENANDDEVDMELLERLRDEVYGSPCFLDALIDGDSIEARYGGNDGRIELSGVMRCLVILCGSKDDAIWWLSHARSYHEIAGSDPVLAIENGDFWSIATLHDWLKIIVHHQHSCKELIEDIFRG